MAPPRRRLDAVDAPRSRPERPRESSAGPPRSPHPKKRRQKIVAALALSGASALVAPAAPRATVKVQETKADLERLCAENPTALPFEGIWDPLGCADFNFWGLGNEATIGYLRHAEIKHGRIAMAGFLGFFVQSPGNFIGDIVSGDHAILPYRGYVAGCTPQEQWANIPMIGKLQILTAVGMLESYGEGAGFPESYTHYTKGGQPGYYPPIKGKGGPFKQILLDLYDPLGFGFRDMSAADKKKGLFAEINNGRMAMIGLVPCRHQISGAIDATLVRTGTRGPRSRRRSSASSRSRSSSRRTGRSVPGGTGASAASTSGRGCARGVPVSRASRRLRFTRSLAQEPCLACELSTRVSTF